MDREGRTIWIVDAHRDTGRRFVVRSDEKLAAYLKLARNAHELAVSALLGDDVPGTPPSSQYSSRTF